MAATLIGTPANRVDGSKKVTGAAQYAAEVVLANMTHAVLIDSTIPGGKTRTLTREMLNEHPACCW